jgi:hypothetical protein
LNLRQNNFRFPEILMLGYDAFIKLFIEHQRFLVRLTQPTSTTSTTVFLGKVIFLCLGMRENL